MEYTFCQITARMHCASGQTMLTDMQPLLMLRICTLMQANKVEKPVDEKETSEEIEKSEEAEKSEENAGGEDEEGKEEISLKEDLNKKTVSQLKELLNTDDFLPFKEEWKSLTKKDDIINYILKKVEEDEKK